MTHEQLVASVWPVERAEQYMKPYGAIRGVNYIPSYCASYIEMWHHFNEPVIRRELAFARKAGFNSLRIFVATCQWESRRLLVKTNLDRFLDIAKELGFSIMLTLQPNTYMIPYATLGRDEDPFVIDFKPGRHDGSWKFTGARIFDTEGKWEEDRAGIERFVTDIVSCYGQDDRVDFWDLYNEAWESMKPLQDFVFACARQVNPRQPLTACWRAFDISDITTFHCYEEPNAPIDPLRPGIHDMTFEDEVARAKAVGRPMLCTECMARTFGNELAAFLPYFAQDHIGFYVWGLCAGTAQYHFPWDWPIGSPEPKRWFHCVMYPDGTYYDPSEIELIQHFDFT